MKSSATYKNIFNENTCIFEIGGGAPNYGNSINSSMCWRKMSAAAEQKTSYTFINIVEPVI